MTESRLSTPDSRIITVLSVMGTRPEAIKMAPVVNELAKHSERIRSVVCSTGQHREMLDQVLELFRIVPDYELDVMEQDQTLSRLTANLITGLDKVTREVKPDWVLAQGDTTTVLAASLVAFYHGARFGHVEAGLRTRDKHRPFPEEMNRRLADTLSDLFFCPTQRAAETLKAEGHPDSVILVTGNTVIDALRDAAGRPYDWDSGPLATIPADGPLVLITAHRRESFGEPFRDLCLAIRELSERFVVTQFVYPVHLNPNVQAPVREILSGRPNVHLIEPLDYLSLVHLMKRSTIILTDSGGIQEEAPGLGVPVLVMRETTERPEGVEAGVVKLVGTDRKRIVDEAAHLLNHSEARRAMATGQNPYGDGHAAKRIVEALLAADS